MREIIEFLGKEIGKVEIKDHQTFEFQAMEAVVKILDPWLDKVNMKNIGSILFAGEHGYGLGGLRAGVHCRKRSFPKGITSKTEAFIGECSPHSRGLVKDANVPPNVYRYRQLHWAFTRKGRWLLIEILYEIEHTPDRKGKSVENASLCVEETSLEALVGDGWGSWILRGLFDEIQRVVEDRVKDLQQLTSLQVYFDFVNSLVAKVSRS